MLTASFDFGDAIKRTDDECMMLVLEAGRAIWLDTLSTLKAPTPTDTLLRDALDFFGPFGAARHCWYAVQLLDTGECTQDDDESFEFIADRVRKQCREMLASGRVKAAGQRRQRTPRHVPGQADLFEGV